MKTFPSVTLLILALYFPLSSHSSSSNQACEGFEGFEGFQARQAELQQRLEVLKRVIQTLESHVHRLLEEPKNEGTQPPKELLKLKQELADIKTLMLQTPESAVSYQSLRNEIASLKNEIASLNNHDEKIKDFISDYMSLGKWLMGTMATIVVAIVGLIGLVIFRDVKLR